MTAPEGAAPEPVAAITDAAARQQVEEAGRRAKAAALKLATLNTQTKNDALLLMAEALVDAIDVILAANGRDLFVLEYTVINDEAHDYLPRVRKVGPDGRVTTLATFAPGRR